MTTEFSEAPPQPEQPPEISGLSREELEKWYRYVAQCLCFVVLQQGGEVCIHKDAAEDIPRDVGLYYYHDLHGHLYIKVETV